ncbi:Alpha/Beta hydrolase protein [Mycena olivaceomarginata]|nr:Alpha/Beta hydrolase protein [Mycena olivaceomarginata]
MSPTIAQLASFVYSVSVGASAIPDDTPYKHIPALIVDNKEMIVCLREAVAGEPLLILVHSGTGFIYSFVHLQMHFRTGLWAIQVVPETPCTSFVSQTDFYYRKIKETQPTGMYHIRGYFRGYSAGVFMVCHVVKLLEEHSDNVIQLVLIDSSPFLAIALRTIDTYTTEIDFADLETLKHTFSNCIWEWWNSRMRAEQMSELMVAVYENAVEGSARAFEFILSFAGEHRVYLEVVRTMIVWMREVNVPVTLYKASRSIVAGVAPEAQKEWWGLSLDWCFTDLQVVEVDTGHDNILKRDKVMQDLQTSLT